MYLWQNIVCLTLYFIFNTIQKLIKLIFFIEKPPGSALRQNSSFLENKNVTFDLSGNSDVTQDVNDVMDDMLCKLVAMDTDAEEVVAREVVDKLVNDVVNEQLRSTAACLFIIFVLNLLLFELLVFCFYLFCSLFLN